VGGGVSGEGAAEAAARRRERGEADLRCERGTVTRGAVRRVEISFYTQEWTENSAVTGAGHTSLFRAD